MSPWWLIKDFITYEIFYNNRREVTIVEDCAARLAHILKSVSDSLVQ